MSYASSSDETSQMLSLEDPGLSSTSSSLTSSSTGILSPSSQGSSTSSLEGKLNVKFAPLPELTPRKRRYAAPLGVAARSQMVLQRRQMRGVHHNHPVWTEEELERQRELAMEEGWRRQNQHHLVYEDDEEDPFIVFGRMVKDAGKTILRKVSVKDLSRKDKKDMLEKVNEHETGLDEALTSKKGQRPTPVVQPTQVQVSPAPPTISTPIFTPSAISTQSSSTGSNVSTTVQIVTSGTSSSQTSSTIAADNQNKGNPDVAPIVGGTVGGFFGLIAIVALIWFILRRRQRWDDIFEKEEDKIIVGGARGAHRPARFSLDADPEPKPYQYGLVGRAVAPSAASPPHSPPMRPSRSPGPPDLNRTSLMPLNPVAASTLTLSSMPSTGSSQSPLYPPQQGFTPKGYQQGYAPPLPSKQSMDWGTARSTSPPHMKHAHSASTASFMSPPVSHAHWTGDVGPGYNGGVAATMTMGINTPVMTPDEVVVMNRSGSPTSIQETRRLQVTNANPDEFEFGESSTSAAAAAAAAAMSVKDKKLRDGKGRLVTRSAGPPIVHVDGGRVVANVEPAASGPQPPAYTD
ncbi:hypothetical protein C0992_003002 [Termitomyces sp. T32_za158]|nr:hypothetical protein C0992_003002 [Termitomyces sp. T32_za158]